jgi:hypothetical protein
MNTNYKNLYTKVYKPVGIERPFDGEWQHRALTSRVGSASRFPGVLLTVVKPTTATLTKYRRKK